MKVSVDTSQVTEASRALRGWPETFRKANARTLVKAGQRGVQRIRREYRMAGETTATATASRTGALADSYAWELGNGTGQEQYIDVGVIKSGTDKRVLEYARVHEHEGTTIIRPKGKALAIPLKAAKTARGVARGAPRDFTDTFIRRSKASGKPIIFQNRADTLVPLFVLVPYVKVKGRPALKPVGEKYIRPEIEAGVAENFLASFGEVAS